MDALIAEKIRTEKGFLGDANGGAESSRVDMSKCIKLQFEVQLGAQVGGNALALQLVEHDAPVAGNSQNLTSSVPMYVKTDADASFTRVDDGNISALNADAGTVLVEVYKDDMTDGYTHVSLQIADPTVARTACVSAQLDTKLKPAYQVEL